MTKENPEKGAPERPGSAARAALENGLLTEDELKAIRAEAAAEVAAEKKAAARDDVKRQFLDQEKRKAGVIKDEPGVELVQVEIDTAPYTDRIVLDGRVYMHRGVYKVRPQVAAQLHEICFRTWRHEAEIDGKLGTRAQDIYRPRNTIISAKSGVQRAPSSAAA